MQNNFLYYREISAFETSTNSYSINQKEYMLQFVSDNNLTLRYSKGLVKSDLSGLNYQRTFIEYNN